VFFAQNANVKRIMGCLPFRPNDSTLKPLSELRLNYVNEAHNTIWWANRIGLQPSAMTLLNM